MDLGSYGDRSVYRPIVMAFFGCCRDCFFICQVLELFEPLQQHIFKVLRVFEAWVRATVVFELSGFDKVNMVVFALLRHYCKGSFLHEVN